MALTRDFKETIQIRIKRDPTFREEMLKEGVECLLAGDMATGKAVLRDYINAAIGFQELAKLTAKSPKSLMRMFAPNGNPQARNLFEILGFRSSARDCISKSTPFTDAATLHSVVRYNPVIHRDLPGSGSGRAVGNRRR